MDNFQGSQTLVAMVMMGSVPCILCLENRMGLRMLMFCLKEGLTNAKGDEHGAMLDWMTTISSIQERKISSSNHKSMHEYLILGMEANPTQWMVHTIPKRKWFQQYAWIMSIFEK